GPFHLPLPRPVLAKNASHSPKSTTRGVVPSATRVRSLGTPGCHPPSPACHHRPYPGPCPRSTLETHSEPLQRAYMQARTAGPRGAAASRQWGLLQGAPTDTGAKIPFNLPIHTPRAVPDGPPGYGGLSSQGTS